MDNKTIMVKIENKVVGAIQQTSNQDGTITLTDAGILWAYRVVIDKSKCSNFRYKDKATLFDVVLDDTNTLLNCKIAGFDAAYTMDGYLIFNRAILLVEGHKE